jgi:hypothetical protein
MDMKDTAPEGMQALWAGQGTSAMRYTVGGLAEACHREWEAAHNAGLFDEPFDWEWCPRWLRERIEWSATGATIKPKEA